MLVQHILEDARRRLAVLSPDSSVVDAARILANEGTPLAVVCDEDGKVAGVISRTDLVRLFSCGESDALDANAQDVMIKPVFCCSESQTLQSVWETLRTRGFRCAPVLDESGRPMGILHARDLLKALLEEVESEEILLRDYVMGVGYQ